MCECARSASACAEAPGPRETPVHVSRGWRRASAPRRRLRGPGDVAGRVSATLPLGSEPSFPRRALTSPPPPPVRGGEPPPGERPPRAVCEQRPRGPGGPQPPPLHGSTVPEHRGLHAAPAFAMEPGRSPAHPPGGRGHPSLTGGSLSCLGSLPLVHGALPQVFLLSPGRHRGRTQLSEAGTPRFQPQLDPSLRGFADKLDTSQPSVLTRTTGRRSRPRRAGERALTSARLLPRPLWGGQCPLPPASPRASGPTHAPGPPLRARAPSSNRSTRRRPSPPAFPSPALLRAGLCRARRGLAPQPCPLKVRSSFGPLWPAEAALCLHALRRCVSTPSGDTAVLLRAGPRGRDAEAAPGRGQQGPGQPFLGQRKTRSNH